MVEQPTAPPLDIGHGNDYSAMTRDELIVECQRLSAKLMSECQVVIALQRRLEDIRATNELDPGKG